MECQQGFERCSITLSLGLPERWLPLNVKSCVMHPGPVVLAWWALAVMPGTCARRVMWGWMWEKPKENHGRN